MMSPGYTTTTFESGDGLTITADEYAVTDPQGHIVLCHRSHSNRGEYRETAPKLQARGYHCLAIDQRSGMNVFKVINETSTRAKQEGLPTGYLEARPDIEAAINFLSERNGRGQTMLLGSSYSADLALLLSVHNEKVKAVMAFSPGEHLKNVDLAASLEELDKPLYVTSAKKEIQGAQDVVRFVDPKYVTQFEPQVDGFHGSKVLWNEIPGSESYWHSLKAFLGEQSD
jgi:alpha-beta hydrolase superfamily lysophospholipase